MGFEVVTRLKRPRGVFFTLGEQHHDLAVLEVPPEADPVKNKQVGLHHVALQVENFDELKEGYRTLKAHDVEITATIDHGITKSIYFLDPEGNRVEIYALIPDRDEGRQNRKLDLDKSVEEIIAQASGLDTRAQ